MESFSKRLERLRRSRNLSIQQVAEQLKVPVSTYRDWEYGRQIKGEPYLKLANVFEVSVFELLSGKPNAPSEIGKIIRDLEQIVNNLKNLERSLF